MYMNVILLHGVRNKGTQSHNIHESTKSTEILEVPTLWHRIIYHFSRDPKWTGQKMLSYTKGTQIGDKRYS